MRPVPQPIGTPYGKPGTMWQAGHHTGVDFLAPPGTPVAAAIGGTVVWAGTGGWGPAYGLHVVVAGELDGHQLQVLYAHLSDLHAGIRSGTKARAGQLLGLSGATGNVSGPHLHLEVRRSPYRYGDDTDPAPVVAWQPETPVTRGRALLGEAITELAKAGPKRWRVAVVVAALRPLLKRLPAR